MLSFFWGNTRWPTSHHASFRSAPLSLQYPGSVCLFHPPVDRMPTPSQDTPRTPPVNGYLLCSRAALKIGTLLLRPLTTHPLSLYAVCVQPIEGTTPPKTSELEQNQKKQHEEACRRAAHDATQYPPPGFPDPVCPFTSPRPPPPSPHTTFALLLSAAVSTPGTDAWLRCVYLKRRVHAWPRLYYPQPRLRAGGTTGTRKGTNRERTRTKQTFCVVRRRMPLSITHHKVDK